MQQLLHIFDLIWQRKYPFLLVFFLVVTLTYGVLYALDFYPEPPTEAATTANNEGAVATSSAVSDEVDAEAAATYEERITAGAPDTTTNTVNTVRSSDSATTDTPPIDAPPADAVPVEIEFDTLGKTIAVLNPTSRAVADLDAALLRGVVRHPDSASFADPGNIFILGHSSYLPNVINKNFQAFNGIQNLEWGDTIRLRSNDREYRYRVDRVYEAQASEVIVPNSRGKAKLTLATCDSFGSKDDRFIVEATLIEDVALAQS